jgi:hypothetical protein
MGIFEILHEFDIRELRSDLERLRTERDRTVWDITKVRQLADENLELKLRLGLLVRLLIAKGVINAEEYATLITQARPTGGG